MITDPISPFGLVSKKRASLEDCESVNYLHTTLYKKNKRDEEIENLGPQSGHFNGFKSQKVMNSSCSSESQFHGQESSHSRSHASSSQVEQFQRYHESVVMSLKMECQMAIEKKNQEMQQLNLANIALIASIDNHKKEEVRLGEESKILKKAVAIQDNRNRELQTQNQQLQNVLQLAAEHIAKLEESNRQLIAQRNTPNFMHFPPPDIC